jgi:hypothetical protein
MPQPNNCWTLETEGGPNPSSEERRKVSCTEGQGEGPVSRWEDLVAFQAQAYSYRDSMHSKNG